MFRNLQDMHPVLVVVGVVIFALSVLSRRFPHVAWLQHFRFDLPGLSEKQRARMHRRAAIYAGAQLILMGIIVPLGYVALTVMFFHDFTAKGVMLAFAGSFVCIGLGVVAIWQNRRG